MQTALHFHKNIGYILALYFFINSLRETIETFCFPK